MNERADMLEQALGGLTAAAAPTGAWRGALERARRGDDLERALAGRRWMPTLAKAAAVIVIGAVLVWVLLPATGHARRSARSTIGSMPAPTAVETERLSVLAGSIGQRMTADRADKSFDASFYGYEDADGDGYVGSGSAGVPPLSSRMHGEFANLYGQQPSADASVPAGDGGSVARHVVRKATVELTVEDVRAAFVRAQQLVSPARGEYVQDSQSRDRGDGVLEADLILRVEAGRLGDVLNELRTLGEVRNERSDADDVTGQVVDLEARLRTHRAVEEELLGLLKDRKDADLDDVIKVRRELASVRQQIEQMEGQRQQIASLVRLATVAVVLRQEAAPPPVEEKQGLGAWFRERMSAAWDRGVRTLLGTLAGIVEIAVGGVVWWVVGVAAVAFAWRAWRRARPRALSERA